MASASRAQSAGSAALHGCRPVRCRGRAGNVSRALGRLVPKERACAGRPLSLSQSTPVLARWRASARGRVPRRGRIGRSFGDPGRVVRRRMQGASRPRARARPLQARGARPDAPGRARPLPLCLCLCLCLCICLCLCLRGGGGGGRPGPSVGTQWARLKPPPVNRTCGTGLGWMTFGSPRWKSDCTCSRFFWSKYFFFTSWSSRVSRSISSL